MLKRPGGGFCVGGGGTTLVRQNCSAIYPNYRDEARNSAPTPTSYPPPTWFLVLLIASRLYHQIYTHVLGPKIPRLSANQALSVSHSPSVFPNLAFFFINLEMCFNTARRAWTRFYLTTCLTRRYSRDKYDSNSLIMLQNYEKTESQTESGRQKNYPTHLPCVSGQTKLSYLNKGEI